ncbi:EF-P 5-aminopentanol modification-associated protein YfmF [Fictibacillus phosphorivorans]|uniref:EF-P 5-aminopentanol modification-associated protein YfmF n=1 Tax=Fictibacillus phosphorivorans TaxID=1221500 RepID=UPI00203F4B0D|nr:insulinase family protein [Fictibacillus phosphorivorans]MCM3774782.1 insulinase family protein [Fictibacillus phosphorivorans]
MVNHEKTDLHGITVHTIETKKYKTTSFILQIKAAINEKDVTKRALLSYVLQSGTKDFPTSKELRSALDDLYGATLNADLSKKGENQVISIRMEVANEKFLSNSEPVLDKAFHLLSQVLLAPALENGVFKESLVKKEKRSLKQQIESIFDDKMRYANKRLLEEMYESEPYHLNVYGKEDEVDAITSKELFEYYQEVILNDRLDLYVIGDISTQEMVEKVKKHFSFPEERKDSVGTNEKNREEKKIAEVKEVFEEQDIQQGKLHMGYRTYTTYSDDDYFALQVFNGVFGGFSHSKLFMKVREKESLAYYAASRFESHKGAVFVMSGIETGNYEKAVKIIKEQHEEMKNGNITDAEFEQTKAMINNQVLETIDHPIGLSEVLYHNVVAGTNRTIEEWMEGIQNVTKEDVVKVAKKVTLDTIYFLKGAGTNGNENI